MNKEMPTDKDVEAGKEPTLVGDKAAPKKPNPSQKPTQQKKGGAPNKGTQETKKDTTQAPKQQEKGDGTTQGTTSSDTQHEQGQTKKLITHTSGVRKKAKAHKMPPEYTIAEDDADLVAERTHVREFEEFEDTQHQRDRIQNKLADMRQVLEYIREAQSAGRETEPFLATSEVGSKAMLSEHDMIQMIAQASTTFHVTPNMMHMDEIVGQTTLKDLVQIQLVMGWIPTKALNKLQVNVAHEVQSCTHTDAIEL
jgi:hypothetical protein